jgi:antirestriction protein ArdC
LPAIEQARQMVKNTQKSELAEMQRMKAKLDAALKEALDKRQVPGRELMGEVANMYKVFEIKREAIARENTAKVLEAMKKVLNEGQIKAAAGALEPKLLDPSLDPKTMTQDDKLRVFVRAILLDPDAYELLIELRKRG